MMFARAIADDNPVYYDADAATASEAGQIIAPPTFVQAGAQFDPDYHLRPKLDTPWFGSGATPSGAEPASKGRLHGEQHFEYHRHISPGDVLSATVAAAGLERGGHQHADGERGEHDLERGVEG